MRALDRKLVRDLRAIWAQGLAIALVLACGIAVLVLATGAEAVATANPGCILQIQHGLAAAGSPLKRPTDARDRTMGTETRLGHCTYLGESFALLDCPGSVEFAHEAASALAIARAVERHGAGFPPGKEPPYHDHHPQAEA
ncbi:MAG: hypothetical protein ACK4ST_17295, partial [Elioraea tepidiphila]